MPGPTPAPALPASERPTLDPLRLYLKSPAEAAATIAEMRRIDAGFLTRPHHFYAVYAAALAALALRSGLGLWAVFAVLGADWLTFLLKRRGALRRYERNPLRLRTGADAAAVDAAYAAQGRRQPSMADWIAVARAGAESGEDAARYRDIARVERSLPRRPRVVVDVGANDGCACWQYGIGSESLFLGIEISFQLLQQLRAKLPQQGAVLADGARLPLRDGSVDFLFCSETLEHLPDPDAAMADFARVLRPGGRLMIQSPNAHRLRNLNMLHVATLLVGLITDRVLLKKMVHENTWINAATYHWDFSIRDYRRLLAGRGMRAARITARGFFVPRSVLMGKPALERWKERVLAATPLVRYFGEDLVLTAERAEDGGGGPPPTA